ncbi:phosphotriesterase [Mycolicibacterium sp. YH-1]|uniref:phosphotriesterase family protein n=1 Tax=Mycolicibacterium sp. YH-1 TaxID=2908837 RepID=UPI001F4BDCD5|nr:hypothetical protein [Mycolicibacterium sp. YH-1]UNB52880.1 hypothetical protein L0M16_00370 [Mycolicibacterium sp. YH-1]
MALPIHTVLGHIAPEELGRTSMHEHVFIDARVWCTPPQEPMPEDTSISLENHGFLRWNLDSFEHNLVLDDEHVAIKEVTSVAAAGGSAILDVTNIGLGRDVRKLSAVARASGVHIMTASGCYIHDSHPSWVAEMSVEELAALFTSELTDGIDGTGITSALLGEIGTSDPVTDREFKVLAAAAAAGAQTGASVSVHLDPRGTHGVAVLEYLVALGMQPERVILGHVDEHLDEGYHRDMLATGATLAYDTFGSDYCHSGQFQDPSDSQRLDMLVPLLEDGFADQLVLACDVWTKINLRTYGGMGYDHLFKRVVPMMRDYRGVDVAVIDQMLIANPRRLLNRP